jgi:hypothetical protein
MSFSTFEISELPEESDNDYAIEIESSETKFGLLVTETEMKMLADAFADSVRDGPDEIGQLRAEDYDS